VSEDTKKYLEDLNKEIVASQLSDLRKAREYLDVLLTKVEEHKKVLNQYQQQLEKGESVGCGYNTFELITDINCLATLVNFHTGLVVKQINLDKF
jgi:hypothetical protein